MKKLLLFILISAGSINYGTNLCIGYKKSKLTKEGPEFVDCNCNCYSQGISDHVDGHRCLSCGHRVLPYKIGKPTTDSKSRWNDHKLIRYFEKGMAGATKILLDKNK